MKTSVTPKVRTQPKVRRTDATTVRESGSRTRVRSPFLGGLSLLVEVVQPLFSKALNALQDGHSPGATVCGESFPSKRGNVAQTKGCFSLNLLSGRPMSRAPVASSERKSFSGGASRQSEPHDQPTAAVLSWWLPQRLACRLCAALLCWRLSSQEMLITLTKASKVKNSSSVFSCFFVELPNLTAIEQAGDNNCTVHVQFSPYCDASLSPYSCPQSPEGSTCFSPSVGHFLVHSAGWGHCAPQVLEAGTPLCWAFALGLDVRLWRSKS